MCLKYEQEKDPSTIISYELFLIKISLLKYIHKKIIQV